MKIDGKTLLGQFRCELPYNSWIDMHWDVVQFHAAESCVKLTNLDGDDKPIPDKGYILTGTVKSMLEFVDLNSGHDIDISNLDFTTVDD